MSATVSRSPSATGAPVPRPDPVESGFRGVPLLTLVGSAAVWLVIAVLFGLIDSFKFHDRYLLANVEYGTYGRLAAAGETALLYGFGAQAAFGIGIWLFCRLGRTFVVGPLVVFCGCVLWNLTVTTGVIAILCGGATGYAGFEMPGYCAGMLGAAFLLIGVPALLTFHQRRPEMLYPSQWFLLGSFFWFPWIFSTAALLLTAVPQRGALQASTAWWYLHNFDVIFLGFAGLAAIFYFIPKMINKPLYSYYLAMLSFWLLALFGSWGGIPAGAPLPSWIGSLSVVGTVFTAIPIFSIANNLFQTVRDRAVAVDNDPTVRFMYAGLTFWIVSSAHRIVGVLPHVNAITAFTWFGVAEQDLMRLGFFAMTAMGALYYIVPRLLDERKAEWRPLLTGWNFWLMLTGVLIAYVSELVAGLLQGALLHDPNRTDLDVLKATLTPLRIGTLGDLLIFGGTVVFLLNFALIVSRHCYECVAPARRTA